MAPGIKVTGVYGFSQRNYSEGRQKTQSRRKQRVRGVSLEPLANVGGWRCGSEQSSDGADFSFVPHPALLRPRPLPSDWSPLEC